MWQLISFLKFILKIISFINAILIFVIYYVSMIIKLIGIFYNAFFFERLVNFHLLLIDKAFIFYVTDHKSFHSGQI